MVTAPVTGAAGVLVVAPGVAPEGVPEADPWVDAAGVPAAPEVAPVHIKKRISIDSMMFPSSTN